MVIHDGYQDDRHATNIIQLVPHRRAANTLLPNGLNDRGRALTGYEQELSQRGSDILTSAFPGRQLVHSSRDRPHVLVMDDNFDILDILGQLLRDERYKVTLSSNPLDVEMIDEIQPDVIITDAVFNGRTAGLEAITRLMADPRTRNIPIIYCTLLPHVVQRSLHASLPVIQKPFELDDILEAVSSAVERAGSSDQPASLS